MVRVELGAWLAWAIFLPTVLVNLVVNMSQMSAMVEGAYGAFGLLPPSGAAEGGAALIAATIVLTATTRRRRGAGRLQAGREDHDRAPRRHPDLLRRRRHQGPARLADVGGARPRAGARDSAGPARRGHTRRERGARFTQVMAIAGQALPPAVMLSYGYLATNSGQTAADIRAGFWRTVTNLGVIWGLFSVVVIVAGATALHAVYTGSRPIVPRRLALLADPEHPGGRPGARPGPARRARLPRAALLLARASSPRRSPRSSPSR